MNVLWCVVQSWLVWRMSPRRLIAALKEGAVTGAVGNLNLAAVNCTPLENAIAAAKDLKENSSETTKKYLAVAQIILKLRQCIVAGDNSGVRKVHNQLDCHHRRGLCERSISIVRHRLMSVCWCVCVCALVGTQAVALVKPTDFDFIQAEVKLAKAEVDNNVLIHQLTEVLSRDGAQGDVGALDLSAVHVRHLTERIESATELGIQTVQAEKLLEAAKTVRKIRTAMVRRVSIGEPVHLRRRRWVVTLVIADTQSGRTGWWCVRCGAAVGNTMVGPGPFGCRAGRHSQSVPARGDVGRAAASATGVRQPPHRHGVSDCRGAGLRHGHARPPQHGVHSHVRGGACHFPRPRAAVSDGTGELDVTGHGGGAGAAVVCS